MTSKKRRMVTLAELMGIELPEREHIDPTPAYWGGLIMYLDQVVPKLQVGIYYPFGYEVGYILTPPFTSRAKGRAPEKHCLILRSGLILHGQGWNHQFQRPPSEIRLSDFGILRHGRPRHHSRAACMIAQPKLAG